jgi:hypothetical protein
MKQLPFPEDALIAVTSLRRSFSVQEAKAIVYYLYKKRINWNGFLIHIRVGDKE